MLGNIIASCLCPLDYKFRILAPHTVMRWRRWTAGEWFFREVSVKVVGHTWSLEKWEECGEQRGLLGKRGRKRSSGAEVLRVCF